MTAPESSRLALYNGLRDALGPELADGLMSYLPEAEAPEFATKSDLADHAAEMKDELRHLSQRIDRLYNAMIVRRRGGGTDRIRPSPLDRPTYPRSFAMRQRRRLA